MFGEGELVKDAKDKVFGLFLTWNSFIHFHLVLLDLSVLT